MYVYNIKKQAEPKMKPGTLTEDTKPSVTVVVPSQQDGCEARTTGRNKRLVIGSIVGLVGLVVIVGVTLGAVFVGQKLAKDSYEESWKTFRMANGTQVRETVGVSNDNEEDIKVPSEKFRIIYDFNRGLAVWKDDDASTCYVGPFEREDMTTPEETKALITKSDDDYEDDDDVEVGEENVSQWVYVKTDEIVDRRTLSPRAREMCIDSTLVAMRYQTDADLEDPGREKRACSFRLKCRLSCSFWRCRLVCSMELHCSWG